MLPNKTPKPKISKVDPSVLPIPLLNEVMIFDKAIALQIPTNNVAIINEINAFNLTTVIKSRSKIIEAVRMIIEVIFFD